MRDESKIIVKATVGACVLAALAFGGLMAFEYLSPSPAASGLGDRIVIIGGGAAVPENTVLGQPSGVPADTGTGASRTQSETGVIISQPGATEEPRTGTIGEGQEFRVRGTITGADNVTRKVDLTGSFGGR